MKIGEFASLSGVGVDTVRYYEREKLLPPPRRQSSGYRSYSPEDVVRLQFVRRSKTLGFTLEEIRDLLALSDHRDEDMSTLKTKAEARLQEVETKLAEITRIRDGLRLLVESCPGHGALAQCPILHALVEDSP